MYLEKIQSPEDVKKLDVEQLKVLAGEMRQALIQKLSVHGGHVGPNLGMVEATIAMHYVFDSPKDKMVFDVSHQSYCHKMLTGRADAFLDEAKYDDVSGYSEPSESAHDFFCIGHTSTSVSLACGLAKARDLADENYNVIAVIGDGSLSGGEALEGLDFAKELNGNLIVVVNDNEMSIAENHGGLYENLKLLRDTKGQAECNIFKAMGLNYVFVEDGNDLTQLIDAFKSTENMLMDAGIDDYCFDSECLLIKAAGKTRRDVLCHGDDVLSEHDEKLLLKLAKRRALGEPLQYILGEWDFCEFTFNVGEGVLIPRPETEMLVENADLFLKNRENAVVYDLCSGSGCIGITVKNRNPSLDVYLMEKYPAALSYLRKNARLYNFPNENIIECDVLSGCPDLPKADLIISNPPYIKSEELPSLQREVGFEPKTALDGGKDGLMFYRAICDRWLPCCKKGGEILLECGDSQGEDIRTIFDGKASSSEIMYDFNHIDRVVKIIV